MKYKIEKPSCAFAICVSCNHKFRTIIDISICRAQCTKQKNTALTLWIWFDWRRWKYSVATQMMFLQQLFRFEGLHSSCNIFIAQHLRDTVTTMADETPNIICSHQKFIIGKLGVVEHTLRYSFGTAKTSTLSQQSSIRHTLFRWGLYIRYDS